jgi:hypothetical protein
MNRGWLGRGRTKHDRFATTVPTTVRKSGNNMRQLAMTSSNVAWLQRQLMNSACTTKKQNDSAEIVMPSEPLHLAILSLSSWK